jgi:hypothetical protein
MTERILTTVRRVVEEAAATMERNTFGGTLSAPGSRAFDDVRELRQRRAEFVVCFEHRYRELFERCLREPAAAPAGGVAWPPDCRSALLEIDRRLEALRRAEGAPIHANPMYPDTVTRAFSAACEDVVAGAPVRRTLIDLFRRRLEPELARMYGDVNVLLARRGIRGAGSNRNFGITDPSPFSNFPGKAPILQSRAGVSRLPVERDPEIVRMIEERIRAVVLPYFVRDFLRDPWARVLTAIRAAKGTDSPEWVRGWRTLEDLIDGLEVFADPGRRPTAIWTLPGLLKRIKAGLAAIRFSQQEQALFLKTLRAHHLRVLSRHRAPPAVPRDPGE